jgi:hypothetical protein
VSSTFAREEMRQSGQSTLLLPEVAAYVEEHGLYGASAPSSAPSQ